MGITAPGAARVSGFIVSIDGQRLIAQPNEPSQASCANLDGDSLVGLTQLIGTITPAGQQGGLPTGKRQHLPFRLIPDREIDEPGTYQIVVTVVDGQTTRTVFTGGVRVAIVDVS